MLIANHQKLQIHAGKLLLVLLFTLCLSQVVSYCTVRFLNLAITVYSWTWLEIIIDGIWMPVVLSIVIVTLFICIAFGYYAGGFKRWLAIRGLFALLGLISANWLVVFVLYKIASINTMPNFWDLYHNWLLLPQGSTQYFHYSFAVIATNGICFILIALIFSPSSAKRNNIFGNAHFATPLEINQANLYSEHGIIIGKHMGKYVRLPGYESMLLVAPTGAGKTAANAIINLLSWQGSGVFNDLKGELYEKTAEVRKKLFNNECYLWAPADSSLTCHRYNPFFYVSNDKTLRIRDVQLIAECLIPPAKLGDAFWYQSSRELFMTLTLYLMDKKEVVTLGKINDLSKQSDFFSWLEQQGDDTSLSPETLQGIYSIVEPDHRTRSNILKDFHSRISLFVDPIAKYATSDNDFDFREIRKKPMSIYINISDTDKERLSPLLTLFWNQFINAMTVQEPDVIKEPYSVLSYLDEFSNMAKVNKLRGGLSYLRSYKIRCVIVVQHLSQIRAVYGVDDAQSFFNAKCKIAFALTDLKDAQFFSALMGQKTVKITNYSHHSGGGDKGGSSSRSTNQQGRPLMLPNEIMQLNSKKMIAILEAQPPLILDKVFWFKERRFKLLNERL